MTGEARKELLTDVKNYLDMTYQDEAADRKLAGMVDRGMNFLDHVAGKELDYTVENQGRQLLFDYCRYARSNDLEEFQNNFRADLVMLRIGNGVEDYAESQV